MVAKVRITDEARDYILRQTDTVTVRMEICGG